MSASFVGLDGLLGTKAVVVVAWGAADREEAAEGAWVFSLDDISFVLNKWTTSKGTGCFCILRIEIKWNDSNSKCLVSLLTW